jgi:hypothetical protein
MHQNYFYLKLIYLALLWHVTRIGLQLKWINKAKVHMTPSLDTPYKPPVSASWLLPLSLFHTFNLAQIGNDLQINKSIWWFRVIFRNYHLLVR